MLPLLHAALGFMLGWRRPSWGLAVLVGVVSVTSSLWWQLGLGNLATPAAYVTGLLLGTAVKMLAGRESGDDRAVVREDLRTAGALTAGFVVAATLLSVLREYSADTLPVSLRTQLVRVFEFNAGGLAGELQAALIAAAGPLLLLAALTVFRERRARKLVRRAFVCAAAAGVAAPLVQLLLADPWVRPDRDGLPSTGLVGGFQDPHSFAAFLLLTTGIVIAEGVNAAREGRRRVALAHALLAAMAAIVLLGTNSRTGIVALLAMGLFALAAREYHRPRSGRERRVLLPVGALVALLGVLALVFAVPTLRQAVYGGVRTIGAGRLAQPLADDVDWNRFFGYRLTRWAVTIDTVTRRPLWGAGPRSIEKVALGNAYDPETGQMQPIPPENTHNYYLQFAAEYGLPAAAALLWLLVGVLTTTARGAARHPEAATRRLLTGILASQVGFLLFGLVSHPMLLAECQAVFWVLCALGVGNGRANAAS